MTDLIRTSLPAPRHLERFGYPLPPLQGGSADADVVEPDKPVDEGTPDPAAPAEGTPPEAADVPVVELPFDINDVEDAQARSWLLARQAQMQSGVTKLVQTVRERERELEGWQSYHERLQSEEGRLEALAELAGRYGIELDVGEEPDLEELEVVDTPPDDDEDDDPLAARVEQLEGKLTEKELAERQSDFRQYVTSTFDAYAKEEGYKEIAEIPEDDQATIIAIAQASAPLDNGFLDLPTAITTFRARQGAYADRIRKSYLGSKDVPHVAIGGSSADPAVDLTDPIQRRARAEAIAARHAT